MHFESFGNNLTEPRGTMGWPDYADEGAHLEQKLCFFRWREHVTLLDIKYLRPDDE